MNKKAVEQAITVLNRALKADSNAVNALFNVRAITNKELADDATIQTTAEDKTDGSKTYTVGPMGLINGLFGVNENKMGHIAMVIDNGKIIRFIHTK